MQAGLHRFGTDFGNGDADRRFFPRDGAAPHYLAEKARVLASHPERHACDAHDEGDARALDAARAWIATTMSAEGYGDVSGLTLSGLGLRLCEDFAVMVMDSSGADRMLCVHACFPGGWRPEHVVGGSFLQVHAAVPAFGAVAAKSSGIIGAMLTRGPYVRFVWTVAADDELDHHPDQGRQRAWDASTERGYLRVERQVTVPLPSVAASVFLIRTYCYAFDELGDERRRVLRSALEQMPADVLRYKRLESGLPFALALLR
jgi:dimethylamine monooxygenase subunit A